MNKSTLLLLLPFCGLILSGCKKEPYIVKSTLTVADTFQVKNDNAELVNLNSGDYPVDLNINSSRAKVSLKTADKKVTFRLILPKNIKFPTNGQLVLSSAQSKQPFDTIVDVKTTVQDSRPRMDVENCQTYRNDYECTTTGNPPQSVCYPVNRPIWGRKQVEYIVRSYNREIKAALSAADKKLAQIEGARVDSERIYTYEGMCF